MKGGSAVRTLLVVSAAVGGLAALVVSVAVAPFLLGWFHIGDRVDWARLSDIGQSYGVASATLSALALCAVAVSTVIQARQARATQLHAARSLHLELLRFAIDRPSYRAALGAGFELLDDDEWTSNAYVNLWMMYLKTAFLTGSINEPGLRRILREEIFAGGPGRTYWAAIRSAMAAEADTRSARRFVAIADEEFSRSGMGRQDSAPRTQDGLRVVDRRVVVAVGIGAAVAAWAVRRSHRRR